MRTTHLLAGAFAACAFATGACAAVTDAAVERSEGHLRVTWAAAAGEPIDVLVAERPDAPISSMKLVSDDDTDGRHEIAAPEGRRLFVLLRSADGGSLRIAERLVPLSAVQNFRDVGGYRTVDGKRVRWGLIYRSAELSGLKPSHAEVVEALGIRNIHDLRSNSERASAPTNWPSQAGPVVHAADYQLDTSGFARALEGGIDESEARETFEAFYPQVLESHREQFRDLFQTLLTNEGPVLYHCSAGKDRTGVATALVLTALGVPRETVIADYELSNRYYRMDFRPADNASPEFRMFASLPPEVVKVFQGVDGAYLEAVFAEIDRRGGIDAYLQNDLGVGPAEVARLKATYLE
jgi:protein-tyrosine phosphatase